MGIVSSLVERKETNEFTPTVQHQSSLLFPRRTILQYVEIDRTVGPVLSDARQAAK